MQEINQLCNPDQAIAIYLIEFHAGISLIEQSTSVIISINPAHQLNQRDRFHGGADVQSNNVLAGCEWSRNAADQLTIQPAAYQVCNPPKVICNNFKVAGIKYGGEAEVNGFVTIWYRVFEASGMERHMIRRLYN